ncbi:MAG: hypothetical protein V2A58_05185 [Planctomycetota bacterium]
MKATKVLTAALVGAALLFFSMQAFGAEEPEQDALAKRFAELDKNKDGKVSLDEFRAAHQKAARPEAGQLGGKLRETLQKLQGMTPEERKQFVQNLSPEERRQLQEMRQGRGAQGKQGGGEARPQEGQMLERLKAMSPEERRAWWQNLPEEQRDRLRERLRDAFGGGQGVPQSSDQGRRLGEGPALRQGSGQALRPGSGRGAQGGGRQDTFAMPQNRRQMMERGGPGQSAQGMGQPFGGPQGRPFVSQSRDQGRQDGGRIIERLQQMSPEERRELWQSLPEERRAQIRERLREWLGEGPALRQGSGQALRPGSGQGQQMRGRPDAFGSPRDRRGMTEGGRPGFEGGPGSGRGTEWYGGGRPRPQWMDRPFGGPQGNPSVGPQGRPYGGQEFGGRSNWQDVPRRNARLPRLRDDQGAVTDRDVVENLDLLEDLDF